MKVFLVLCCAIAFVLATPVHDDGIDWSKVRPVTEFPSFRVRFPNVEFPKQKTLTNRITGGQEAERQQFPYQAAMLLHLADGVGLCGGSIVSNNYLLTAAHCLQGIDSGIAILGAHDIRLATEPGQVRVNVNFFVIHPNWDSASISNDVGLVRFPAPIVYTDSIQPVRLPNRRQIGSTFENQLAAVSGWGVFSDNIGEISPLLQFVRVPVITNTACRLRFPTAVDETNICTSGDGGLSPCNGDSGGPLTITDADMRTTQIGSVSFGSALGCEREWPAVYARLTSFIEWIGANSDVIIRDDF